jgi:predicted Rossmann fold nucleotide-binding protein DprA/Smf involved in DNA uptake
MRGEMDNIKHKKIIAFVGSRACTSYGANVVKLL